MHSRQPVRGGRRTCILVRQQAGKNGRSGERTAEPVGAGGNFSPLQEGWLRESQKANCREVEIVRGRPRCAVLLLALVPVMSPAAIVE